MNNAKYAQFGVMFMTLMAYYVALLIIVSAITDKYLGTSFENHGVLINVIELFGPYLVIYFLFISPNIKGEIDDNMPEEEQRRKKRTATVYFILGAVSVPLAGLIYNLITGYQ